MLVSLSSPQTILPLLLGVIFSCSCKICAVQTDLQNNSHTVYANAVCSFDIFFQNKESTDNVELSYKETKKYKATLIIRHATYADTGYYFCVKNETTACNIKMEGVHRKYVYVTGQYQDMLMSLLSCEVDELLTRSLK